MERQDLFTLADRLLDGQLVAILHEHRNAGLSYQAISRKLEAEYQLTASDETVRRWILDHEPEQVAS